MTAAPRLFRRCASRARTGGRGIRIAALAVALSVVAAPVAASAATDVPGDWWYERYGVADVQAEGWNGAGVRIAVLDAMINDELPVFADAALTIPADTVCGNEPTSTVADDGTLHGSNVTAILVGNGAGAGAVQGIAPGADVTFYSLGPEGGVCRLDDDRAEWAVALDRAVADGADIVTISRIYDAPTDADAASLAHALASGVIVVAGVPNELGTPVQYPAGMNGVVSVNAFDADGMLLTDDATGAPNVQPEVTVVAPGDALSSVNWEQDEITGGSSFATPMVAGILAVAKQKYPDATANQFIQSLIRNTGAEDHALERDTTGGYGYGPASLRHVLAADPAQYPDENPLMDKAIGVPTVADVAAAEAPQPTASVDATPPAADGDETTAAPIGWIVGGVAVAVVVAAAVIVVASNRARARSRNGGSA